MKNNFRTDELTIGEDGETYKVRQLMFYHPELLTMGKTSRTANTLFGWMKGIAIYVAAISGGIVVLASLWEKFL